MSYFFESKNKLLKNWRVIGYTGLITKNRVMRIRHISSKNKHAYLGSNAID